MADALHANTSIRITAIRHVGSSFSHDYSFGFTRRFVAQVRAGTAPRTYRYEAGMKQIPDRSEGREGNPSSGMSDDDKKSVDARGSGSAKVVHEVVRLQGDEELGRPLQSLIFSGFAAGVAISTSLLAEAALHVRLPEARWADLVVFLGYPVGFIIVILGKLQLFTESTVTAVLPLATHPTFRNLLRLLRLWAAVFAANMAGTLFVAFLTARSVVVGPDQLAAAVEVSSPIMVHDWLATLLLAT